MLRHSLRIALILLGSLNMAAVQAGYFNPSCGVTPFYTPPATPFYTPPATPFYTPPATPFYTPPAAPCYSPPTAPCFVR